MADQTPRYCFVFPPVHRVVGGNTVLINVINILNASGRTAVPLYGLKHSNYKFADCDVSGAYSREILKLFEQRFRRKKFPPFALKERFKDRPGPDRPTNSEFEVRKDDVFVLPDFWYPELSQHYQDHRQIVVAQDVFGFLRATLRDRSNGNVLPRLDDIVTTSVASRNAVTMATGQTPHHVTLSVGQSGLSYEPNKKLQIAYMPRKRVAEARLVTELLKTHPSLKDVPIVPIKGMSNEQVVQTMRESLIFLSFSQQEGFGLPPAEAMLAGSLVVGYTGVGGDEYFDDTTAFPIGDNDIVGMVDCVARVVDEYRKDPNALDAKRKAASDLIKARYSEDTMRDSVLAAWSAIEAKS